VQDITKNVFSAHVLDKRLYTTKNKSDTSITVIEYRENEGRKDVDMDEDGVDGNGRCLVVNDSLHLLLTSGSFAPHVV
jgi:hypothetical protein